MNKRPKERDWSEWKSQMAGEHRVEKTLTLQRPNLNRRTYLYEATSTGIAIPQRMTDERKSEKKIPIWILVFFAILLARKCYHTVFPELRTSEEIRQSISR